MGAVEDLEHLLQVAALLADMMDILYSDHSLGTVQVQELEAHQRANPIRGGVAFDGLGQVEAYIDHNR